MNTHVASRIGARAPDRSTPAAGSRAAPHVVRRLRGEGGFTLLEVIAAIMLLAIAFTALLKVAGASMALTQNAADRSAAAMLARSKLDTEFIATPLQIGHSSGQFDQRFSWQLDVRPWNDAGGPAPGSTLQLYQLDLTVSWGPNSRPRSAHFRTLRLAALEPAAGTAFGRQP